MSSWKIHSVSILQTRKQQLKPMEEEAEPLLNAIRAGDPSLEKVLFAEDIVYRK